MDLPQVNAPTDSSSEPICHVGQVAPTPLSLSASPSFSPSNTLPSDPPPPTPSPLVLPPSNPSPPPSSPLLLSPSNKPLAPCLDDLPNAASDLGVPSPSLPAPAISCPPVISSTGPTSLLRPGFIDTGGASSFASHQPLKDVQPPRFRASRSKADSAQGLLKNLHKAKADKAQQLQAGVAAILRVRDKAVHDLAEELDVPVKTIFSRVLYQTSYMKNRAPNVFNALVYVKGIEMNDDRSPGDCYSMKEIQAAVKEGLRDGSITEQDKKDALIMLTEVRELKSKGSRSSNTAADADSRSTVAQVTDEVVNLGSRTGATGLALFVKGHIHDDFLGTVVESAGSSAFFLDVLNISAVDVLAKFEQWVCTRDNASLRPDSLRSMKSECSALVTKKLRVATNQPNVKMNYLNYVKSIVLVLRVHLIGWPAGIPFATPSDITTAAVAKRLRNALTVGSCAWTPLTSAQFKEYEDLQAADDLESGAAMRRRKVRSDKGKQRTGVQKGKEITSVVVDQEEEDDRAEEDDENEDDNGLMQEEEDSEAENEGNPPLLPQRSVPSTTIPTPVVPTPISAPLAPTALLGAVLGSDAHDDVANGADALKKKRKERSNKGTKRPRKQADDKENLPAKKAKKTLAPKIASSTSVNRRRPGSGQGKKQKIMTQLPPGFKSPEFIEEDEEDEGAPRT